jgi:transposase-like protein
MLSVEAPVTAVKLSDGVRDLIAAAHQAGVAVKQCALQAFVDETAARELGRPRGEPKSLQLDGQDSQWHCSRCGSARKGDLSYSGSYRRAIVFEDGPGELVIPRLRCRCGGNVKPDFGALLPKRKRLWYDLELAATELHVEGMSYRGLKRHFARVGCEVGIGTLSRTLAGFAEVDINAGVAGDFAMALGADAAFVGVAAGSRAHYYIHEILPRDEPLIRDAKAVAWHRMGKVLACHQAAEETLEGWEQSFEQVVTKGFTDPEHPPFVVSDGNQGLRSAVDLWLPWSVHQRCIWHIAHRAREKAPEAHKDAFERDALWVLKAPNLAEARARRRKLTQRWRRKAPDALANFKRKFDQGTQHLRQPAGQLAPRAAGISERYNQEPKRRSKAMRGYRDEACMQAMTRLIALRHNCNCDRTDWLNHAAQSVWCADVNGTTAQQHNDPPQGPYTIPGT